MKTSNKILSFIGILALLFTFSLAFTLKANKQPIQSLAPNQEFVTSYYDFERVDELHLSGRIQYELFPADRDFAEVITPKNLEQLVIVDSSIFETSIYENSKHQLINDYSKVKVRLGLKNPKDIYLSPAAEGSVTFTERFDLDVLNIELKNWGKVLIDIEANRLNLTIYGHNHCVLKGHLDQLRFYTTSSTSFLGQACTVNHLELRKYGESKATFRVNESYHYDTVKFKNVKILGDAIYSE